MIGCGCGEKFKTQAGLNEHRRLRHLKSPAFVEPTVTMRRSTRRISWTDARRAIKAAQTKAQWQGPGREKLLETIRAAQRRRRERERLARSTEPQQPQQAPAVPDPKLPLPAPIAPVSDLEYLKRRVANAIADLISFEIQRALAIVAPVVPNKEVAAPAPEAASSVVSQPPPQIAKTVPLPRKNWGAAREIRVHRIEPEPLPDPLPKEVETVREPEDPENIHRNLGMRAAVAIAHRLGCRVRKNSSGEIEFAHPLYFRRLRVNAGRHTAPRVLLTMLREVEKSINLGKPTRVGPTGSV